MNFVAIPKCASKSISWALGIHHDHGLTAHDWDAPRFAVLRDPVDRFRSAWAFLCDINQSAPPFHKTRTIMENYGWSADEYVEAGTWEIDHPFFWPQSYWTAGGVERFLRFEKLAEDFAELFPGKPLPRINRSVTPITLTETTRARLADHYSEDCEKHGKLTAA